MFFYLNVFLYNYTLIHRRALVSIEEKNYLFACNLKQLKNSYMYIVDIQIRSLFSLLVL